MTTGGNIISYYFFTKSLIEKTKTYMLGTAEDEISSNLQEFQGVKKVSKKFFGLQNEDFRDFQLWRREPPYL